MTDKERVLMHILHNYYLNNLTGSNEISQLGKARQIEVGDLVLCATSGLHDHTIGYVVSKTSNSEAKIREIGSSEVSNISNELFYKIDTSELNTDYLLEGIEYKTYQKVIQAFDEINCSTYKYHSISFKDGECMVNMRRAYTDNICKTFVFMHTQSVKINYIISLLERTIKSLEEK